ncbi:MAG TPA: hypothetical protein DEP45_03900 [Armatimonadetes bacterium]|nr:hypothetical protein [Armatimonadota bacterium]
MTDRRLYAVLSGDIVESRRFVNRGPAIRDAIKAAYRTCAKAFPEALGEMPAVDVFAGDSWQMLISSPATALRVALCMRALIKAHEALPKVDTRVAIGIGAVEFIDRENLSESQGEAFMLSGGALERLRSDGVRLAVALPVQWGEREQVLDPQQTLAAVMVLLEVVCAGWTKRQAAVVAEALMGCSQTKAADELGITQPAVSQALDAGEWTAIAETVRWWETWNARL